MAGEGSAGDKTARNVGLVLAALTLIVTTLAALPSYLSLRTRDPRVVYEAESSQMLYPPDADRLSIRSLLRENGVPDAFATLRISNRGDALAKQVKVALAVNGRIVATTTDPATGSDAAWVSVEDLKVDDSKAILRLRDLAPMRILAIKVSYISDPYEAPTWDVFADGQAAERVTSVESVPQSSLYVSLAPFGRLLSLGIALSFAAYLLVRFRGKIAGGALAQGFRAGLERSRWRSYKNHVVASIAESGGVEILDTTDGSLLAREPGEFWDGILLVEGAPVVLEIHTGGQRFWNRTLDQDEFELIYCLRVYATAQRTKPKPELVAVVNDEDVWTEPWARSMASRFARLAGSGGIRVIFLAGKPEEVAAALFASIASRRASSDNTS